MTSFLPPIIKVPPQFFWIFPAASYMVGGTRNWVTFPLPRPPPRSHMRVVAGLISSALCAAGGRGGTGKVLFLCPLCPNLYLFFFVPVVWWNLPLGGVEFYIFYLVHGYLLESAPSRFSLTVAERDWGRFFGFTGSAAHTAVSLPITGWRGGWDFFWVCWPALLDPTTPTEALAFMDGVLLVVRKRRTKSSDILWHHDATSLHIPSIIRWISSQILRTARDCSW